MFQMVSANCCACAGDEKPAAPVAPPRLIVTILPLDWQVWMADARNWQLGRSVPEKVPWFQSAHVCNAQGRAVTEGVEQVFAWYDVE